MPTTPTTSISLLKDLASGCSNARWSEFVRRYDGFMRDFLMRHYPSVDADDVLQNVFISLTTALPNYHYTPDAKGHFHNYLAGVLRHKAADAIRKRTTESERLKDYANDRAARLRETSDADWREALMHAALEQLMADDAIVPRNREIFRHVALLGEAPERVAADFGVTRGNVDVIKKRLLGRLQELVSSMLRNG